MARTKDTQKESAEPKKKGASKLLKSVDKKAIDPGLASLFASSLGPVQPPPKSRYQPLPEKRSDKDDEDDADEDHEEEDDEELSELSENEDGMSADSGDDAASDESDEESEQSESDNEKILAQVRESVMHMETDREPNKRKRAKDDDLEGTYLGKLAREEAKDEERRQKKQKTELKEKAEGSSEDEDSQESGSDADESSAVPQHESLAGPKTEDEVEKASRTVFLGNVSNEAITSKTAKKTLLKHLASFIPSLPENKPPHKVESLRFRSTAFSNSVPKKAAFAKQELMDATTKSTNAYAVYTTAAAARQAVKRLNGTVVLDRHLRVDSVAHPSKVDNRRCVFVGNLGFVDDESSFPAEDGKKKKTKPPADVEEGLWVQFSKAGKVENVRVVRDAKTRVGKGFAYVQFEDENGVEAALQFNDQKYPPLLPRKLRVVRAKGMKRSAQKPTSAPAFHHKPNASKSVYIAKVTDEQKSLQGRARGLLGKAGAFKSAESFVFEGQRARQGSGGGGLGGKKKAGKGKGKPKTRSSKRGAAWKASGGKKAD